MRNRRAAHNPPRHTVVERWNTNCPPPWQPNDEFMERPVMVLTVTSLCTCCECSILPRDEKYRGVYDIVWDKGDEWDDRWIAWRWPLEAYQGEEAP